MPETLIETMRHAAKLMRQRAEIASTGEPWEADKHYDALYYVDLKPSLGATDGPDDDNCYLKVENCAPFEAPRFLPALHEYADHIASWHPAVALAVADWLDSEVRRASGGDDGVSEVANQPYQVALAYLGQETADA